MGWLRFAEVKFGIDVTDGRIRVYTGMLLSLAIHAFFVTGILLSVTLSTQNRELIGVYLTLEPPGGGGGSGENRSVTAADKAENLLATDSVQKRRPARQLHPADLLPPEQKTPVESAADAVPLAAQTPVRSAIPIKTVSSGVHGETAKTANVEADGNGGGRGTGIGNGVGMGSGSSVGSGAGGQGGGGNGRNSAETLKNRYLREHFAYIRDLILKNLAYPPMARKSGWQGRVKVSFIIREDGRVEDTRIVESSGYFLLDRNVADTIRKVQPFPKPPVRAELMIPVAYVLNQ